MSRRDYPVADRYEDRERDFYPPRGRGRPVRDYEEIDVDIRRGSVPDFLRDDYGRSSTAGPLVRRARTVVDDESDVRSRRGGGGRSEIDRKEEIIIKERERESDRRSERSRYDNEDTYSRKSERRPVRPREIERDEVVFRRGEGEHRPRPREVERDFEVDIRRTERGGSPGGKTEKEEIIIKEDDVRSRRGARSERQRSRSSSREKIVIRSRSKSRSRAPPPRELVARETEEFVIRRRRPPSPVSSSSSSPSPPPPRRRERIEEEIIIRRMERSPSPVPPPPEPEPEPEPEPSPEPEPVRLPPIVRPPIHQEIIQEIITHHRHIDHGVERYRSPSPEPLPLPAPREPTPPPAPPKIETLEIDIRRRENGRLEESDIRIERREKSRSRPAETDLSVARPRARSLSSADTRHHHHHDYDDDIAEEADYYNRRALSRGHAGEAYNGATRDWALVDVPPGTERVRMDGAGGGAQEISWKRYDGNRRSKFFTGDREYDTGFGERERRGGRGRQGEDMWTEVTKDLVIRDAVDAMGYQYEESEQFFYVMEYLKYEDVLQLVELSDDIRADRRRRVREIELDRGSHRSGRGERGFEREFIFERERRR